MARILLTGDKGYLGTRFHRLYDHEHDILGVDQPELDIVDREAVHACVSEFGPDLVIHAAAITSTDFSNAHPDLTRKINVDGAVHVAEAAGKAGAKLIFFSTEQVFNGNPEPGPYNEDHKPQPNTMYGETKLEAEGKIREILSDIWVLRFTWLYGLPERNLPVNPNILWNTVRTAVSGRKEKVAVNEYRGHTHGYDMIENVMKVPDIPYGTYHIGCSNDLGRYDVAAHILREMGLGQRVDELLQPDTEKYPTPRDVRLATDKIAAYGITFDDTATSLTRTLKEFALYKAF